MRDVSDLQLDKLDMIIKLLGDIKSRLETIGMLLFLGLLLGGFVTAKRYGFL